MIAALLLAAPAATAPAPATAIDAERAFVRDAQKLGQWTAFRKYAADDAVMFVPKQTNAQAFLKPLKDPPESVYWWPGRSYVSCDGRFAVNTGPWVRAAGKAVGYFTTVWRLQDGGWRWIYDGGDALPQMRSEGGDIKATKAACTGKPRGAVQLGTIGQVGYTSGGGRSPDGTLVWSWAVGPKGERTFLAQLWTGARFETVVHDKVAAAPQ